MEYLSKIRELARDAFFVLSLAACTTPQNLPEARVWSNYDAPGTGRGMYLFSFKDTNRNGTYDLLEIRFKPDQDPVVVLVGEEDVGKIYNKTARKVVESMDSASQPAPATQAPSN